MLAHVLHAFGGHAKDIEIMVLDICETPLMLCKWYGAREEVRVETHACDIVQWETTRQFDLIVTHSFLPMLPAPARHQDHQPRQAAIPRSEGPSRPTFIRIRIG